MMFCIRTIDDVENKRIRMDNDLLTISLALSLLLCSLVAGFLFAYAVVIMPGIKNLDDEGVPEADRAQMGPDKSCPPCKTCQIILTALMCNQSGKECAHERPKRKGKKKEMEVCSCPS